MEVWRGWRERRRWRGWRRVDGGGWMEADKTEVWEIG